MHGYQYYARTTLTDEIDPRLLQRMVLDNFVREISSHSPCSVKDLVLKKFLILGKNRTLIAKELGISRKVVTKILKESFSIMQKDLENVKMTKFNFTSVL